MSSVIVSICSKTGRKRIKLWRKEGKKEGSAGRVAEQNNGRVREEEGAGEGKWNETGEFER